MIETNCTFVMRSEHTPCIGILYLCNEGLSTLPIHVTMYLCNEELGTLPVCVKLYLCNEELSTLPVLVYCTFVMRSWATTCMCYVVPL